MPEMGVPSSVKNASKFGEVKMANKKQKQLSTGDVLNNIAGVKKEGKGLYVDPKKHNKMDKDAFLKLLSFQMQNQDPLNPMDQKKFAADLAQFSQLEQMTHMNSKLEKLSGGDGMEKKFQAASFLGKEVVTSGSSIHYRGDGDTKLSFYLGQPAKKVIARVFDSRNQMIQQMDINGLPAGAQNIPWDGTMMDGQKAGKGDYRITVQAWDGNFEEFPAETKSRGVVTAVGFDNGETIFTVDGKKKVYLRDVTSFGEARRQETASTSPKSETKGRPAMPSSVVPGTASGLQKYQQAMNK